MVCSIRLTPGEVRASDAKLLAALKQDLRQDLLDEEFPVDISLGGIPLQVRDFDSAATELYLRCYHVVMRRRLVHLLANMTTQGGVDIVPHIATVTAIEMPKMVTFLKGFQILSIMELHRLNNYVGWHNAEVQFVPREERTLGDKYFKDPNLFI